jgi:hypothetical protein
MPVEDRMPALAECAHEPTRVQQTGAGGLALLFAEVCIEVSMHSFTLRESSSEPAWDWLSLVRVRTMKRAHQLALSHFCWRDCGAG